ncbi:beta-ketoacyl synthase N-terminal-like domain-containing protein, partial [Micromonospora humida]|uniref:beta-ketoacyl synthase N-terminal-like domain-containing protein n=1 Tax=Micromonospora humida TaxID=2809018 RepID=UPI00343AC109
MRLRLTGQDPDGSRRADVVLLDTAGRVLVSLTDVVYRPVAAPTGNPDRPADPSPTVGATVPAGRRSVSAFAVEETVVEVVRTVLRDPDVTATGSLAATGIDSMLATMVAADLQERLGVTLGPVEVLQASDCRALAAVVASVLPEQAPPTAGGPAASAPGDAPAAAGATADAIRAGTDQPAPTASAVRNQLPAGPDGGDRGDLAVIGIACALPGATDPESFWSLLARGGSGIGPAPAFRWAGGGDGAAIGGFLGPIDEFDARFFDFFAKQAEVLDPQVRWLLRTAWEALESAGIAPLSTPASTGVFVGASYQHYKDYNLAPELDAPSGLGNHNAFLANRVSYFLDLSGPSMTIDTLCSSSLVALHT